MPSVHARIRIRNQGVFVVVNSNNTNNNSLDAKRHWFLGRIACQGCCILFAN